MSGLIQENSGVAHWLCHSLCDEQADAGGSNCTKFSTQAKHKLMSPITLQPNEQEHITVSALRGCSRV